MPFARVASSSVRLLPSCCLRVVAGVMVFGYLLNGNKPDEPEEIVTALSYTAALFFVIAVVHATLRESAAAIGLTYLEYLYLFLYVGDPAGCGQHVSVCPLSQLSLRPLRQTTSSANCSTGRLC